MVNGKYQVSSAGGEAEKATISACRDSEEWLSTANRFSKKGSVFEGLSSLTISMDLGNLCRDAGMTPRACKSKSGIPVSTIKGTTTTTQLSYPSIGAQCTAGVPDSPKVAAMGIPFDFPVRCVGGKWIRIMKSGDDCSSAMSFPKRPNEMVAVTTENVLLNCVEVDSRYFYLPDGGQIDALYNGTYTVGSGTGTIAPGTYAAVDVRDCYWDRRDNRGNIIANNFGSAARMEFTAYAGESVTIRGSCGAFKRV